MTKKTIGTTLAALTVGAVIGVAGLGVAQAATSNTPVSNLIENLATKFNTSTDNVKSVFEQTRTQNETAREQKIKDALTQEVKDGKITQSQMDTIVSKLSDIQTKEDAAQAAREDLKTWADNNNVDLSTVFPMKMGRGRLF